MNIADVIDLYIQLHSLGIEVWLDGGWGVDALLGEQTRPHGDVDIVVQQKDVPKLRELLEMQGYKDVPRDDTSVWNFVLGDNNGRLVDVHAVTLDAEGNGLYGPPEKGVMYPAGSLTGIGVVNGHTVKCISVEYMVKFHTGYKLRESDFKDISALCARFGIDYPEEDDATSSPPPSSTRAP
jgi:lincosamide nucleotidyltransferase A/C/D/E